MAEVKEVMGEKEKEIEKLESTVSLLQQHVQTLKLSHEKKTDDLEQYGRRLCLRIHGVQCVERETSSDVLNKVKDIIDDSESEIPENVIDRAHRIGRKISHNGEYTQSIIVRFTTFRHRTLLYKNRKKLVNENVKIRLDLTKLRNSTLNKCREFLNENPGTAKYVYADINCRLKIRMNDDKDQFFETFEEFKSFF